LGLGEDGKPHHPGRAKDHQNLAHGHIPRGGFQEHILDSETCHGGNHQQAAA
jgi:hypothetical protein